jgi:hypothetical protein
MACTRLGKNTIVNKILKFELNGTNGGAKFAETFEIKCLFCKHR